MRLRASGADADVEAEMHLLFTILARFSQNSVDREEDTRSTSSNKTEDKKGGASFVCAIDR